MKRKRVVVDTNVVVSAAINRGYAFEIIDHFSLYNTFQIFYSEDVMDEYRRVSSYERLMKKFSSFKADMEQIILALADKGQSITVTEHFPILKDPSDNKFLDLAYACNADYLITGNHLDFTITEFHQTKIVSPKEFWERYESGHL